ncbi:MAG TPA: hypothetical protein DCX07_08985 [Phycisphaerales bacterium]|nr:hypothetical protein [Phycisphaerales bacterium]
MGQASNDSGGDDAERFVADHCQQSFLSLWTYANPRGKKDQELCDVMVVCDSDIIVLSVKHIEFKDTGNPNVDIPRWQRKAVDGSVKQVFGAERVLSLDGTGLHVVGKPGERGLTLPPSGTRRVHRIAVALGGEGKIGLSSGWFDNKKQRKYVHVLDSPAFIATIRELDTISDFVAYLLAKESLQAEVIVEGGEEDLLAMYLQNGRQFPDNDLICLGEGVWQAFSTGEQYLGKKRQDEISYVWDRLIETFCQDHRAGLLLGEQDTDGVEQALRTMAREDRFTRRGLGKSFSGFLEANKLGQSRSRIHPYPGLATYVFLGCPVDLPREDRIAELKARCLIARWLHPDKPQVVGIATETPKVGQGFSLDLLSLTIPRLSREQAALAQQWQEEFGFFKNLRYQ